MTTRKQVGCAAGLCLSMAMLLAFTNHDKRSDTHKLSPPRYAAAAVSVPTAIKPRSSATVFDPVLDYSTFLGGQSLGTGGAGLSGTGSTEQSITTLLVDSAGNAYVAGATSAANFPITPGVVQSTNTQQNQVGFLSKIDPTGHTLIFSTYLDGMGTAASVALDASGNIYIAGVAPRADLPNSTELPLPIPPGTTPFDSTPKGISIVKLNSTATAILAATYFGGSGTDAVTGLAVDATGVYISGTTTSNNFPTKNPLQGTLGSGGGDYFVAKLDTSLSTAIFSSYLGQNSILGPNVTPSTLSHGIAVDSSGNVYVVGAASPGFPTTSGAFQNTCSNNCAFLAKLNAAGSALSYATYVGTSEGIAEAVAVDASQNVYIGGENNDPYFPEVNSLQPCNLTGVGNGFLAEINAAGTLTFSTCLGQGTLPMFQAGISDLVLGPSGNVYVIGSGGGSLPLVNPIQSHLGYSVGTSGTSADLFVAEVDPRRPALLFSSLINVATLDTEDYPTGIGVDSNGDIFASGFSTNFQGGPAEPPIFPVFNGLQNIPALANSPCFRCTVSDGFVMKIAPTNAAAAALIPDLVEFSAQAVGTSSTSQPLTIIDMGSTALAVSNATVTGDFSIQNNCTTVAPAGGTCAISVIFTPTALGTRNGVLTITDSSAGSPRTVQLTGLGGAPMAVPSPSSLSFPAQAVGTSSPAQQITLTNPGAFNLQINRIQASGDFSQTNACGASVTIGLSCTISVIYSPTSVGAGSGTLTITDNAANSPQTVALTGAGVAVNMGLGVPSGGSASASVSAGQSAMYKLSIGGEGLSGTASLSCSGAPTGASCSVPATIAFNGTAATNFTVSVTTTARSGWLYPHRFKSVPWLWAMALIAALVFLNWSMMRPARLRFVPLLAVLACGCGGGASALQNRNGTQAGTYTVTVTATSGVNTQTQSLTLTVN